MRPLLLEFQGLHSYREPVSIDFSRLTEGGFFGIFGPTGAGKSTILDAITFALFGRIDRTSSLQESLSSGAKTMWARFRFRLGDEEYEVYRKMERRGSGLASVDFYFERDGKRIPLEGIRELERTAEELLGLSFDQFITAVFLPQGKFARFLKLKPAERRRLLAEIFRLERFGDPLYRKVRDGLRKLEAEEEALSRELDALEGITSAALEEAEVYLFRLEKESASLEEELVSGERERISAQEFLKLWEELTAGGKRFSRITGKPWSPGVQGELRQRLELSAKAQEVLAALEERERLRESLAETREELGRREGELRELLHKKAFFEEEASRKLERLRDQERRLREYKGILEGLDPARLAELRERLAELKSRLESLGEEDRVPFDPGEIPAIQEAATEAQGLIPRLEELSSRAEVLSREISGLTAELVSLEEEIAGLEEEEKRAEEELSRRRGERRTLLAVELAQGLREGDPCPVCGATHHPRPATPPPGLDPAAVEEHLSAAEEALRRLRDTLSRKKTELAIKRDLRGQRERELQRLRGEIGGIQESLQELKKTLPPSLRTLDWGTIIEQVPGWREALRWKEYHKDLTSLKGELGRLEELWGRVLQGLGEIYQPLSPELLEEMRRRLEGRLRRVEVERRRTEANAEEFRRRENELRTEISAFKGKIEELERALRAAEERLGDLCRESGISPETAPSLSLSPEERETLEQALELGSRLDLLRQRLEQFPFADPAAAERVIRAHREKRARHAELQRLLGETRERVRNMREALERKRKLDEELRELRKASGLHRELEALLRGKALVEYLVASRFQGILSRASFYTAQLSQGRYVLQGEGTELVVIDYRNGGSPRSPNTLSGGETFLVSLSLALALSEAIQLGRRGGAPPIEFFFIDEGFGALDEESVGAVLELLYRLVDKGLHVGVITHVEALRHGIPRKLLVHPPTQERGSRVEILVGE